MEGKRSRKMLLVFSKVGGNNVLVETGQTKDISDKVDKVN